MSGAIHLLNDDYWIGGGGNLSGTERMWQKRVLTIDGTDVSPDAWFDDTGLNTADHEWTCRISSVVASLTSDGDPPTYGSVVHGNTAATGGGGKYFEVDSTTLGNIGANDFIIFFADQYGGSGRVTRKRDAGAPNFGWDIYPSGAAFACAIDGPGGTPTVTSPNYSTDYNLYCVWCDRDEGSTNGCGFYRNTVMGDGVDPTDAAGDADHVVKMWLGCDNWAHTLGFFAIYTAATIFPGGADNVTEMNAVMAKMHTAWAAG